MKDECLTEHTLFFLYKLVNGKCRAAGPAAAWDRSEAFFHM